MKVLVINPIMYTSETKNIKRAASIKDTMMYDFCLAFHEMGHSVTLVGGEPFKPTKSETYPFEVLWWECKCQKVCMPHCLPFMPETYRYVKQHRTEYDLIITSEVFSLNSLMAYRAAPDKTIIWHELAKHNNIFRGYASKFWYGVIAKSCFKKPLIVARSEQAKKFISKYCKNVSNVIIDHGVNTDKFIPCENKDNQFAISSQLIPRKHIEKSIRVFANYLKKFDSSAKLYIMGEGEEKENLKALAKKLNADENIIFTGKLNHSDLIEILKKSKAMLVYTEKDNNMVSIVESIALATPIISTSVPYNSSYIKANELGIVKDDWNEDDLNKIACDNKYINNCMNYRKYLPTEYKAEQFLKVKGLK